MKLTIVAFKISISTITGTLSDKRSAHSLYLLIYDYGPYLTLTL